MEISLKVPERRIGIYDWNFQDHLGSGSFARVYCGKNCENNELVAIKVIDVETIESLNLENNLQKEIAIMKALKCPNIIKFYEAYLSKKNLYIVMEFCSNGDLRKFMKRNSKNSFIPEALALKVLKDILNGFKALLSHKIVHRDLKPENILQNDNFFKISDFGFSTQKKSEELLESHVGTPLYMSPQVLKSESYTEKADIWSLGMIYYELLNGKTPWIARSEYELVNKISMYPVKFSYQIEISEKSKNFILKCLEPTEKDRCNWETLMKHPLLEENNPKAESFKGILKPAELDEKSLMLIRQIQEIIEERNIDPNKLFHRLDQSKDNNLDIEEFTHFIKNLIPSCEEAIIYHVFNKFDADKSHTLSVVEFKTIIREKDFNNYIKYKDPLIFEKADRVLARLRKIVKNKGILIKELFIMYDSSKNNSLEIEEFEVMIRKLDNTITAVEVAYIFEKLDYNNDKTINIDEFKCLFLGSPSMIQRRKSLFDPQLIAKIEKLAAICKRKKLNPRKIFESMGLTLKDCLEFTKFYIFMKDITDDYAENEIRKIFNYLDSNDDGKINFFEFQQLVE